MGIVKTEPIHLDTGTAPPNHMKLRRLAEIEQRKLDEEVIRPKAAGVIEDSHSNWACTPVRVKKATRIVSVETMLL